MVMSVSGDLGDETRRVGCSWGLRAFASSGRDFHLLTAHPHLGRAAGGRPVRPRSASGKEVGGRCAAAAAMSSETWQPPG